MKAFKLFTKICAVIFTLFFGIVMIGGSILEDNADAVNDALNIQTEQYVEGDSSGQDSYYYKSAFTSVAGVRANGMAYCEAVMAEGATLLKNDNNALPLASGATVSLFSTSSVNHFAVGTGSSNAAGASSGEIDFKTAFEDAGLVVNEELWNWYESNFSTYGRKSPNKVVGNYYSIGDAAWDEISTDSKTDKADAAIFVLSRSGGEGADMCMWYGNQLVSGMDSADDMTNGDYLQLSPTEQDVLKKLKEEKEKGTFGKIIVLMNAANPVQCDFVDDEQYGVDALLWIGTTGTTGAYAVGRILTGAVNPSGRLSDTFWKYHYKNPAETNFGMNSYEGTAWGEQAMVSDAANGKNTVYQEGIYVGYRYTETRYEDFVTSREKTGAFDYYDTVSYPFGYGLSYTTFEYSDFQVEKTVKTEENGLEDNIYTISLTVRNTGSVPGKEVVQVYLQKPYTDYDRANGIEKASVELVGFAKTGLLDANGGANDSETVEIVVEESSLTSYDAKGAKTYILEAGDYYFTAARDAHDAVNNILKAKDASAETVAQGNTTAGDAGFVELVTKDTTDTETYSVSTKGMEANLTDTETQITNRFDKVDITYYQGATSNFRYMTRSDWEGTVSFAVDENGVRTQDQVKVTVTDEMSSAYDGYLSDPAGDGSEYPAYGVNNDPESEGHLNLIDLRAYADEDDDPTNNEWIPYDHELWDTLLDQLTWQETVDLLSHGYRMTYGIASIAKPQTIDHNGACGPIQPYGLGANNNGFAKKYNDPDMNLRPSLYPCNGIAAATFNKALMEYYGKQWGEDCLWAGYSGLYGMGINTHRSPYGGRNFEYYSEDPVLAGQIAAEMCKGMRTRGVLIYLKHCFLNDQESYRYGGFVWANEQTCREIYLKPFQIAIEDGGAQNIMSAFPLFGMDWSGSQGFINSVLRAEFGMSGFAVSDWKGGVQGNWLRGVMGGNDLPDGTHSEDMFDKVAPTSEGGTGEYGNVAQQMRECAHRILYAVVHSNAMNGFTSDSRIIRLTPWWQTTVDVARVVAIVLFTSSMILLAVGVFWEPIAGMISEKKSKGAKK